MKFESRKRIDLEELEQKTLVPYAFKSAGSNSTRLFHEQEHPYRTNFQRDRDRIIHSRAFRRLKHKRQVFLVTTGDHYRTRLTHTIEVVQLSRSISRALGLNEDLTEAIALGHDLGHTPFGHIGEVVLHKILSGKDNLTEKIPGKDYGGFKHNYQSVRVVDHLEKKYSFDGLNLTGIVREGILKHTRLNRRLIHYPDWDENILQMDLPDATSLEGQVVATCDEIAQRTHDLEDGLRAEFVSVSDVRNLPIVKMIEEKFPLSAEPAQSDFEYIGRLIKKMINIFVTDVIETSLKNIQMFFQGKGRFYPFDINIVSFGPDINPLQLELDQFITERIIHRSGIDWGDDEVVEIIRKLFGVYLNSPDQMQSFPRHKYYSRYIKMQGPNHTDKSWLTEDKDFVRLVADYIAGMTDHFAMKEYERLLGSSASKTRRL